MLDGGCGFGRVASELTRRGHDCTGVDADPDLIAIARAEDPRTRWLVADLAALDLGYPVDVTVLAGNVIPFLADGTGPAVLATLARHLQPGGRLVAGFTLAGGSPPRGAAEVSAETYDAWAGAAGLALSERYASWDRDPWREDGPYAVSVHVRAGDATPR